MKTKSFPRALTIAGSDSGGGAGIQADLKTFFAHGAFGMSAVTAVTAQNTKDVTSVEMLSEDIIREQIRAVVSDIGVDAAKTGMLATEGITRCVAESIRELQIPNLVVDPVMISKSGHKLLADTAISALLSELLPLATIATPNLFEAEIILGREIRNLPTMKDAAKALFDIGVKYPLIKGGHLENLPATDILYDGHTFIEFASPRIETKNTHGTGCTFSAAITARLAKGDPPQQAVAAAKEYITGAIQSAPELGAGHGPVNHFFGTQVNG